MIRRVVKRPPHLRLRIRERSPNLVHHLPHPEPVPSDAVLVESLRRVLLGGDVLLRPPGKVPRPARDLDVVGSGGAAVCADVGDERLDLVHQAVLEETGS